MSCDFYILGSNEIRPASTGTIFCDGSADHTFREGIDLELSHWSPNRTPTQYRADTSTEICLNFVSRGAGQDFDLAINNHVDVDGILSVFAVVNPETALLHRDTLIAAAEMGDFEAWGPAPAQLLFQSLSVLIQDLEKQGVDMRERYGRAFQTVRDVLAGSSKYDSRVGDGLTALRRSVSLVESGRILRRQLTAKLTHYAIPRALGDEASARYVPSFNEPPSSHCLLWPHARAKFDAERVQLVSVEGGDGWHYDLCYPGYMWADTETLWRAPGFEFADSTNGHYMRYEPLELAVKELTRLERTPGKWLIAEKLSPFESIPGRNFPVVMTFAGTRSRPSKTPPARVEELLVEAYPG